MTRTVVAMLAAALAFAAGETAGAQQAPVSAAPPAKDSTRMATVTYISGTSVYVGAGRLDGVREGMLLEVLRAGSVIARANVAFLASHSSSSEVVWSATAPAVGDSVRYHPAGAESVGVVTDSAPMRPASRAETAECVARFAATSACVI